MRNLTVNASGANENASGANDGGPAQGGAGDVGLQQTLREALADRDARLGFIVGQMPGMLWSIDTDLRCTSSLGGGLADLGLEPNQIVGVHLHDFAGTSDPSDPAIAAHRQALAGTASSYDAIFAGRNYAVHVGPLRGHDGTIRGAIGISFDVTDREAARVALSEADDGRRQSESLLKAIIEGTNDHIHVKDLEGRYLLVNRSDAAWFGLPPEEIIGRTDVELIGAENASRFVQLDRRVIESGRSMTYEQEVMRDGVTRHWLTSKDVIRDEAGQITGVYAISREVTDQKRVESQLRQSSRFEAIGQLAGGVAHDFNNMLTAIRGYTELVRTSLPPEFEQERADLREVVRAADRAADLTRQLLAFSRQQVLAPEVLCPSQIVQRVAPLLRRLLGEHVDLVTDIGSDVGLVRADPGQLEQVIVNLTLNARDAMPGGGRLTVRTSNVELDAAHAAEHPGATPGPYVQLTVSDTGVGMDEETQRHIFEPFFTTKGPAKATGMGLATVDGIVKQSGGYLQVFSEPGRGTTFHIRLPRLAEEWHVLDGRF